MSFFCDFLKSACISDDSNLTKIDYIFGRAVQVVGNIKMLEFSEDKIVLKSNLDKILIYGEKLKIKTISKGEIVVVGDVFGVCKND